MGITAAIGSAIGVGAATGMGSAVIQANAAKRAAQTQADALRGATSTEERMQLRALGIQQPFTQGGTLALQAYLPLILGPQYVQSQLDQAQKTFQSAQQSGADAATLTPLQQNVEQLQGSLDTAKNYSLSTTPLYQFEQDIGQRALNRQLSAQGLYGSGAGLESQAFFQRALSAEEGQRQVGYLQNLIGVGAGTGAQQAQTVVNTGNQIAGLQAQTGAALAQGTLGAAQAYGGALSNIGGQVSQGAGMYAGMNFLQNQQLQNQQFLNSLANRNTQFSLYTPSSNFGITGQ